VSNAQNKEIKKTNPDKYMLPKLTVSGAEKPIPIGELVVLEATLDQSAKDISAVSYSWTVLPSYKNLVTWPDGTKIILGTGTKPQTVTVILTASVVFATKEADKITDIALKTTTSVVTVKIVQDADVPDDNNEPEGGLTKEVKTWLASVKSSNRYTDANIKQDANKIANNFDKISAAVAAGAIKGPQAILTATKEANDDAIGNRDAWLPFFNSLSAHLQAASKTNKLKTDDQYASTWREIAAAIKSATK
jgi:hypothetical protein